MQKERLGSSWDHAPTSERLRGWQLVGLREGQDRPHRISQRRSWLLRLLDPPFLDRNFHPAQNSAQPCVSITVA